MKNIVVACGGGIATSQTVAVRLESLIQDSDLRGQVSVEAININSLPSHIASADVYVSIARQGEAEFDIPTFSGIPFLTGMGADDEFARIVDALRAS